LSHIVRVHAEYIAIYTYLIMLDINRLLQYNNGELLYLNNVNQMDAHYDKERASECPGHTALYMSDADVERLGETVELFAASRMTLGDIRIGLDGSEQVTAINLITSNSTLHLKYTRPHCLSESI
jgi:hypothetical protein